MTTPNDKTKWNYRLKTADNAYLSEFLNNFGLSGGPSLKDLPYIPLTGMAAMGIGSKIKELKERTRQGRPDDDNKNINDFSDDMSRIRDIIDQRKMDNERPRNHPSVPGFQPETRSPYGVYDDETDSYVGDSPNNITHISEHPRFNSSGQGRAQRGRPFDMEEE